MTPIFTLDESITPEGRQVLAFIESLIAESLGSYERMNALPGYAKHYHVNVLTLHAITPAVWLAENADSGALAAWHALEAAHNGDEHKLAAQLELLNQRLDVALAHLRRLDAMLTRSVPPLPSWERRLEGEGDDS